MLLQEYPHTCGAAALANAMEAIGRPIPQEAATRLAKTDHEGTDEKGIRRALRELGQRPEDISLIGAPETAWSCLQGHLVLGRPVLLVVDEETHWVTAVGVLGTCVVIVDSADGAVCRVLSKRDLMRRWDGKVHSSGMGRGKVPHFGIAVCPKNKDA